MSRAQLWSQYAVALAEVPPDRIEIARIQTAIEDDVREEVERASAGRKKRNPCEEVERRFADYRAAVRDAATTLNRLEQ